MLDPSIESKIIDCFNDCISRWNISSEQGDSRSCYFKQHFKSWMESLPSDMQNIALRQMEDFEYYSEQRLNGQLKKLYFKLQAEGYCNYDTDIFTTIPKKNGTANSSHVLLMKLKRLNNISSKSIVPDPSNFFISGFPPLLKTIIFVDDFCGTGDTFIESILKEEHSDAFQDKKIVYAVLHCLDKGKAVIVEKAKDLQLNVDVISLYTEDKTYDDFMLEEIKNNSEDLGIDKRYALGYKDSQALVAFSENTPNNTFGYIWYEPPQNNSYSPIFPRNHEKRPQWQNMAKQKSLRSRVNYESKIIKD